MKIILCLYETPPHKSSSFLPPPPRRCPQVRTTRKRDFQHPNSAPTLNFQCVRCLLLEALSVFQESNKSYPDSPLAICAAQGFKHIQGKASDARRLAAVCTYICWECHVINTATVNGWNGIGTMSDAMEFIVHRLKSTGEIELAGASTVYVHLSKTPGRPQIFASMVTPSTIRLPQYTLYTRFQQTPCIRII